MSPFPGKPGAGCQASNVAGVTIRYRRSGRGAGGSDPGAGALTVATEATADLIRLHAQEEARQVAEVALAAARDLDTAVEGGGTAITTRRAAVSEQIRTTARGEQAAVDQWHEGAVAAADSRIGAEAQRARGLGAEYGAQA